MYNTHTHARTHTHTQFLSLKLAYRQFFWELWLQPAWPPGFGSHRRSGPADHSVVRR